MYDIEELKLITGVNLIFDKIPVKIHQPTIIEISNIGEERFFNSLSAFNFDLEKLKEIKQDVPKNITEYEVLLQFILNDLNFNENFFYLCNNLLFINYEICLLPEKILYMKSKNEKIYPNFYFDQEVYLWLKNVIKQIFSLNSGTNAAENNLNPTGEIAEKIASKIKKSREKVQEMNGENNSSNILATYISILSIGSNSLNIIDINNLTLYQLYNQFKRYNLYEKFNNELLTALVGAKVDLKDWKQNI